MSELRRSRVGVRIDCPVCHHQKKPVGRSAPLGLRYCEDGCAGYWEAPRPGSLWPGESEHDFGFHVHSDGTTEAQP